MANYCGNCGNALGNDAKFCPVCGTAVSSDCEPVTDHTSEVKKPVPDVLYIALFCTIWAIIALFTAISLLSADVRSEALAVLREQGYSEDFIAGIIESVVSTIYCMEVLLIISGILAAVCAFCTFKKSWFRVAFWTALLSSMCGIVLIVSVVGFVFVYLIYRDREGYCNGGKISIA